MTSMSFRTTRFAARGEGEAVELHYFSSGARERVLEAILAAGHVVPIVFVTDPIRWPRVAPTIDLARQCSIPVRVVRKEDLTVLGGELRGQICLSVGFAYLFPVRFIEATKLCLNVHGTLLPKYAGLRTLNWVLENGDTESGVTVHQIDAGVDTGPILLQRSFPLSPFDTGGSLHRKTLEFEPAVVVEALALYESGQATFVPQERSRIVRYPDRVPEHSELDAGRPLRELYNKIRAADPDRYPAYFYVAGEKVCVRLFRPDKGRDEAGLL
jgi:methionyl-tRNA formyltransferase